MSRYNLYYMETDDYLLGAFVGMTFLTVVDNISALNNQPALANGLQLIVSVLNLILNLNYIIQDSAPNINCMVMAISDTIIFVIFETIAVGLIISRCTVSLAACTYYTAIRISFMVTALAFILFRFGSILATVIQSDSNGICVPITQLRWDIISKISLTVIYACLLICLLGSLWQTAVGSPKVGESNETLAKVEYSTKIWIIKISVAIMGFIAINVVSLFGLSRNYNYAQYIIGTYCTMMASNWCCAFANADDIRSGVNSGRSSIRQALLPKTVPNSSAMAEV
ncbi:hypothetical protein QVD99_004402 [Batrachochytrium dendrobatidis]|nr:hypothetical protein O5D80_002467 [Batrachochytrium dendrobatidis]KAK5668608.1 hypothetical protein QVD99_004402 [Batrachochytrium dendrobatidis]